MSTPSLDNKSIFIIGRGFIGSELKSRMREKKAYGAYQCRWDRGKQKMSCGG